MLLRVVRLLGAGALIAAVAVPACGNSSDSGPTGASGGSGGTAGGGASGEGGMVDSGPVPCGTQMCPSETIVTLNAPPLTLAACCADESTSTCGLDTTFLAMFGPTFPNPCQARDQPGTLDKTCSRSTPTPVQGTSLTIQFDGCCRADTGTCGYDLRKLGGLYTIGLGCVDSSPFLEGGTPAACGDIGAAGQGGSTGVGSSGAPGTAGETAAGGASAG